MVWWSVVIHPSTNQPTSDQTESHIHDFLITNPSLYYIKDFLIIWSIIVRYIYLFTYIATVMLPSSCITSNKVTVSTGRSLLTEAQGYSWVQFKKNWCYRVSWTKATLVCCMSLLGKCWSKIGRSLSSFLMAGLSWDTGWLRVRWVFASL